MGCKLIGKLTPVPSLIGKLTPMPTLVGRLTIPMNIGGEYYQGAYEFTPGENQQVIEINGKIARENIVINPIPQNYGRIAWNGSRIMVS